MTDTAESDGEEERYWEWDLDDQERYWARVSKNIRLELDMMTASVEVVAGGQAQCVACTYQVLRHAYALYASYGSDEMDQPYPYPPGYMDAWKSSRVWFVRECLSLACSVTSNRFVDAHAAMRAPRCESGVETGLPSSQKQGRRRCQMRSQHLPMPHG